LYARVGEMFEENLLDVGNTVFGVENIIWCWRGPMNSAENSWGRTRNIVYFYFGGL
jgi:hypothetical protein